MKTILYTWFAVLLFGMAAVSCGDDDTKNNDTTGITGSSWKASETVGADRTTKKYTFKASANWVAQSDKPEWCKILTSSGDKGSDRQLNITVEANETGSTRSAKTKPPPPKTSNILSDTSPPNRKPIPSLP